jgi:hypothetical protein
MQSTGMGQPGRDAAGGGPQAAKQVVAGCAADTSEAVPELQEFADYVERHRAQA